MNPDHPLHESDPRAQLMGAFPTDGAIEFLSRTVARRVGTVNNVTVKADAKRRVSGPTDLPEHFPWPRADGWDAAEAREARHSL
jgi:hypothetical protein